MNSKKKNTCSEAWFLYGNVCHGFSIQLVSYEPRQGEATVVFNDAQGIQNYLDDLTQKPKGLLRIELRISHKKKVLALTTERSLELLPSSPKNGITARFKDLVDLSSTHRQAATSPTPSLEP